ncbi:MAG: cytochrome P450, partial [Polyangiaceae bacterium]
TAVRRIFEGSIMLQDGADHDRTREILGPAVGKLALRECRDAIDAIWTAAAERAAAGGPVDVYALTERTTFEVAANVLVGLALGEETQAFRPLFERLIGGIMAPVPVRVPFGRLDRALRARDTLARLLRPRIEQARARPPSGLLGQLAHHRDAAGDGAGDSAADADPGGRLLPVDRIVEQLLLLFWAGYDTTASAGSWVLHELARRPDWQERLRAEVDLESDAGTATRWFLQEVERMYPSALFFPRVAVADFAFDGYTLPRGTPVFYSPFLSHRDPATWDAPHTFDPMRWSPGREHRAVVGKLVGFGGGPRICLGKPFARQQLERMIRAVLSRYRVAPDPACRPSVLSLPVHHPLRSRVVLTPLERS